jgi:hypothetical protein
MDPATLFTALDILTVCIHSAPADRLIHPAPFDVLRLIMQQSCQQPSEPGKPA